MKNRSGEKIKLASIDELLGVVNEESAMEIEISKIHPFKNHPFKVLDDEKMQDLVESVKINGVLTPVLLRMDERFYGELVIDYASKCVHIKGNALELTKLEYEIIEFLSMNPEMVFDKERIYEKIGGYDAEGDSRVVTELIRRIRKKMKMYSEHEYIATVWGRGYKWAK